MDYMTILLCFTSLFTLTKLRQLYAFSRSPDMKSKKIAICVISHNGVGTGTTEPGQEYISILEIQTAFHIKERTGRMKYNCAVQPVLASNQPPFSVHNTPPPT